MLTALVVIFVVAYAAIALEHPLKVNKSASALIGAGLLWTVYAVATGDHQKVGHELGESLMSTAQIAFFLMGELIETGPTVQVFTKPANPRTDEYLTGRFG